jgi:hypothetical protein
MLMFLECKGYGSDVGMQDGNGGNPTVFVQSKRMGKRNKLEG